MTNLKDSEIDWEGHLEKSCADRLEAAREIILNFTRACNKEHVRKGDWACKLCSAGDGWLNGNG